MATLHLNKPNRPKGEPTRVGLLGVFENGGTYELENLEEDLWIPSNQEGAPKREDDNDSDSEDAPTPPSRPVGKNTTAVSSAENAENIGTSETEDN